LSEDKAVILYFFSNTKELFKRNSCSLRGTNEECPNAGFCNDKELAQQPVICDELLDKLEFYEKEREEVLEREIAKIIINNLNEIDWGVDEALTLYKHEYPIPIGRPDILLSGTKSSSLYIIELKRATGTREHVGQLLSYVGWYQENKPAEFKYVKGILLARELDEKAKYAIKTHPDLQYRTFTLKIEVS